MPPTAEGMKVYRAIMAGETAPAVSALLRDVPQADRKAVLCSLCEIHCEIAANSREHGVQVCRFLRENCPEFVAGVSGCERSDEF